jgi:hypothetical protein
LSVRTGVILRVSQVASKGMNSYSEGRMFKSRAVTLKLLIITGLLAVAALVIILSGGGLLAILLSVTGLAVLLLWFTRKPRPEGELPCASVSCRHYLGDNEEDHTQHPQ